MDNTKWQDETLWPSNCTVDCNSLISSKNVLLIHCPICPFFTFNYKRLLEHLAVSNHVGILECVFYRCNECKKISTSSSLLKEHFSEEHSNSTTKHSTPVSCLGVQRFTDKKSTKIKTEGSVATKCIFCTYQGSDLPNHYSAEHNVFTGDNQSLKPALNSILNVLSANQNGDMQMSDGTLIVMPEEPEEGTADDSIDPLNSSSRGSRKRKMYPPISNSSDNNNHNGNNGLVHVTDSDNSESNSEIFNNQFVSNTSLVDNGISYDSPNQNDSMSTSFIDTHMNNVMLSEDDSSEHSSDLSRPLNGDINSFPSSGYQAVANNNRTMTMFGPRMMRKRGRPPKISSQIFSKEEIETELFPHIETAGKIDGKDAVRIASGESYSMIVPLSLLVSAFDTDGVQYLKNLIRFYYKPEQLALFAWDVTQKRGRPRTSITVCSDPNTNDVANINLQSLRQQSFVQASMRLIERMFGQAFPSNLPIFINRLLQSHRFYVYGTTGASSTTPAPCTNPLIFNDNAHNSPILGSSLPSVTSSPYRDAESRLSRFWIPCPDSDKDVRLTATCPRIRKHLLVCAYDSDPIRFFRNLVRSALPIDELLRATWKGRNTGRPRFLSALPSNDEYSNDDLPNDDKRPLIDHPLVQAFLEFVPQVCGRRLPDNLGPIIHQLLATVRKTHCNNGLAAKTSLSDP